MASVIEADYIKLWSNLFKDISFQKVIGWLSIKIIDQGIEDYNKISIVTVNKSASKFSGEKKRIDIEQERERKTR